MDIEIGKKYERETKIVSLISEWHKNLAVFIERIKDLESDALKTYTYLLAHKWETKSSQDYDLSLNVFKFEDIFETIIKNAAFFIADVSLFEHIVDIFDLLVRFESWRDPSLKQKDAMAQTCEKYFMEALEENHDNEDVVELFLHLGYRISSVAPHILSINVLKIVIDFLHSKSSTPKIFAKSLLLIENSCTTAKIKDLFEFIWPQIKRCMKSDKTCSTCYSTFAHLVYHLIKCEDIVEKVISEAVFWDFIENGLLSPTVLQTKQTVHILNIVIELIQQREVKLQTDHLNSKTPTSVWQNYFAVIESLQEIQSHLILSTMNAFLTEIMGSLSIYWQNILFTLVLRHENHFVAQYGVHYVMQHTVDVYRKESLATVFHSTLNNTYLYSNSRFNISDLSEFLAKHLNKALALLMDIKWKSVPLWHILNAILDTLERLHSDVDIPLLVRFMKLALKTTNNMFKKQITNVIVDSMRSIGFSRFDLSHLLYFYDVSKCSDLFSELQPLTIPVFEDKILQPKDISRKTKIDCFSAAFKSVKVHQRLDFLNEYHNTTSQSVIYPRYLDFEIVWFHCFSEANSVLEAVQQLKKRLQHTVKPGISITALSAAVVILEFITANYADITRVSKEIQMSVFPVIKDILQDIDAVMSTIPAKNLGEDTPNQLKVIKAILCQDRTPPKNDIHSSIVLTAALKLEEFELCLVILYLIFDLLARGE